MNPKMRLTDLGGGNMRKKEDGVRKSRQSEHLEMIGDEFDKIAVEEMKEEAGTFYKVDKNQPNAQDGKYYLKKVVKDKKGEDVLQVLLKFDPAGTPIWSNLPAPFIPEMAKKSPIDQKVIPIQCL